MDLGLAGKAAAVMAASTGIGRACALALAEEGANVAICARDGKRLEATAEEIRRKTGVLVEAVVADLTDASDVRRFIDAAAMEFGDRLDVLITNTGGPPTGTFSHFGDDAWQSAFELLVLSNVRAIRAALPHLEKRGGSIVNIASTSVRQPIDNLLLSNALRPAVVGLAKSLATELAPRGIRVNTVCPGAIATDRMHALTQAKAQREGVSFEEALRDREAAIPAGRLGEPREIGEVVAFLASDRAGYLTGQTILVDGGVVRAL